MIGSHLTERFPDLPARLKEAEGHSAWRRWWIFRDVHRALGWKFWALVLGGATLPAEVEHFWTTLGFVVVQGYGMTETAALVSLNHPFHPARGTLGQVLPGREVRLSAEGEILVKGETVSGATWAGGAMLPRESEWLATGDLGELDAAGALSFRGRKKDVIVTASGLNIYPEDLEATLLRQPQVRAAAIVEGLGPRGPHPLAVLVMRGTGDDAAETVRAANRELAEFQQIRHWTILAGARLAAYLDGQGPAARNRGGPRNNNWGEANRNASERRLGEHNPADHRRGSIHSPGQRAAFGRRAFGQLGTGRAAVGVGDAFRDSYR